MTASLKINPYNFAPPLYANESLSNVSDSGREFIAAQGMPDYGKFTSQMWDTIYQASEDRLVIYGCRSISSQQIAFLCRTPDGQPAGYPLETDLSWGIIDYMGFCNNSTTVVIPKGYYYKVTDRAGKSEARTIGYFKLKGASK